MRPGALPGAVAAPVVRLSQLLSAVHWSYSLLALTAAMVLGGLTMEAVGWGAAPGGSESLVRRLYWAAGGVAMLSFLLLTNRSLRRTRSLEDAVAAHTRELVQVEDSLREAEERFQTLAASSPDGIAVTDPAGNVLLFNQAICDLFGYTPEEMQRLNVDSMVPAGELTRVRALRSALLEDGQRTARIETRHLRRDGQLLDVELSAFPFREHGRIIGLLIGLRDITAGKQAQAEIERRVLQHSAVAELGVRALRTSDRSWLMQEAAALVATTLDVECCSVHELVAEGKTLRLCAGVGWRDGLVGEAAEPVADGSQAVYTLIAPEPVSFEDLRSARASLPCRCWPTTTSSAASAS